MKEDVEKLIKRISEEADVDEEEVKEQVEKKEKEFSGLISTEGAAHIVAKEAGLDLMKRDEVSLDIDNIIPGMNTVTVTGKIQRIFDTREFETEDGKGKVANIILADESGTIRTSFWNEEVEELIENEKIQEGDVIEIENGYVKKDNRDQLELRLGRSGKVKKSDEEIDVEVSSSGGQSLGRTEIRDLSPGANAEIRGTLVKMFENKPFFLKCPECDERIEEGKCEEHDKVKVNMALSGVMDDGTENIRTVFFGEQAEKVLGMSIDKAWELTEEGDELEPLHEKYEELVGKELIVSGRTKMNSFFERIELIANSVEAVDPKQEAEKILSSL
ncbi:MAG: DUF2240 family protein [Candidatus Aenigmatarchaeota archaeon]